MASGRVLLLLILGCAVALSQANVVILTSENFESEVTHGVWLVKFYAAWCGHCKRLAPTWESLSVEAAKKDIKVGKVDCNDHESLCMRFMVAGYPTVKLIREGKVYEYEGGRTIPEFIDFAENGYQSSLASTYPSSWVVVAIANNVLDQLAFAFKGFGEDIARHVFISLAVAVLVAWSCGCVCGRATAPSWKPNPALDSAPITTAAGSHPKQTAPAPATATAAAEPKKTK